MSDHGPEEPRPPERTDERAPTPDHDADPEAREKEGDETERVETTARNPYAKTSSGDTG